MCVDAGVVCTRSKDQSSLDLEEKELCSPSKTQGCLILCLNYSEPQDTQGAGETLFLVVSVRVFLEQISFELVD